MAYLVEHTKIRKGEIALEKKLWGFNVVLHFKIGRRVDITI